MKKVVIFGGGTGLSCILSGLKLFPIDVTTVIAVSDNGSSTGKLKEELNIPAVGDVGKVLLSMANVDEDFIDLLSYRFEKGSLNNHPVRNIVLAALIDLKGNLTEATKYMCKLLDIKGTVLPLTGEKIDLVGESTEREYFGEEAVSRNIRNISRLSYDHDIKIEQEIREKIEEADLIIFSAGSLYTSIVPHLLAPEVRSALEETKAPLLYISNLVTQPGETDIQTVSRHVEILNEYLGSRKIDLVVANNGTVDENVRKRYLSAENKRIVQVDHITLEKMGVQIIEDDIFCIEDEKIRHNALKTAFLIFSYLMES
ncbi:MAG: YvcK family protein [Lachnospiraceae bacterium]|nr:YvcK family protein [Lachnospiraceae bacterium]